jgi:hypothetical protein
MAITRQTMTDEQRKSVALECLRAFDNGGVTSGGDTLVCEGTSHGEHRDGPWRVGVPDWAAGRDTSRYPWLAEGPQG